MPHILVDAHQDIAWNTLELNRDFAESAYAKRKKEVGAEYLAGNGNTTTGLPEALLGRVGIIFGTLWTQPKSTEASFGPSVVLYETPREAYNAAIKQLDVYNRLADTHRQISLIRTQGELTRVLDTWSDDKTIEDRQVGIVILMEGGDPILEPRQFEEWYERGVRVVGPAWTETRYCGGTGRPGRLTALGRELLEIMATYNAILDVSHMAEEAYLEAMDLYPGTIIASHSNPRKFRPTDRHLSDDMIRRLVERGGVMGIVPYNVFLRSVPKSTPKHETPLDLVIQAIDYVCQLAGSAQHVGIGTDTDGGFGYEHTPAELDTIADLLLIGDRLKARGYSADDIEAILSGNFLRMLRSALPR
jgi:membrane dipeptidase